MTTVSTRSAHSLARSVNHSPPSPATTRLELRARSKRLRRSPRDRTINDDVDDDDHDHFGTDGTSGECSSDLVLHNHDDDDEEIESVEAEGPGCSGDHRNHALNREDAGGTSSCVAEKRILTAALVTSIVEASTKSSARKPPPPASNMMNGTQPRRSPRTRGNVTGLKNRDNNVSVVSSLQKTGKCNDGVKLESAVKDAAGSGDPSAGEKTEIINRSSPSESLGKGHTSPPLVTPPGSEGSSFSSVGSTVAKSSKPVKISSNLVLTPPLTEDPGPSNNSARPKILNPHTPKLTTQQLSPRQLQASSRTIYPRASKLVATTKVTGIISPKSTKPSDPISPGSKKRKLTSSSFNMNVTPSSTVLQTGALDTSTGPLSKSNGSKIPSALKMQHSDLRLPIPPSNYEDEQSGNKTVKLNGYTPADSLSTAVRTLAPSNLPYHSLNAHLNHQRNNTPTTNNGVTTVKKVTTKKSVETLPIAPKAKIVKGAASYQAPSTKGSGKMLGGVMAPNVPAPSSTPVFARGLKMNPSPVPNPLAGMSESPCTDVATLSKAQSVTAIPSVQYPHSESTGKPSVSVQKPQQDMGGFTNNTNSLMSAAPEAVLTSSNPPSRKSSEDVFATIAESMSSQQWQTDGLTSSATVDLGSQARGRIFSIDLDPSVLDFVESVVDPLSAYEDDDASPDPPPVSSEAISSDRNASASSVKETDEAQNKNPSVTFKLEDGAVSNSGSGVARRDRGFSFEFFSFGISEDEPLPPTPDLMCANDDRSDGKFFNSASVEKRLRGDSIIFDPTSFHDGGIHETSALSALLQIKQESVEGMIGESPSERAEAPVGESQSTSVPPTSETQRPLPSQPYAPGQVQSAQSLPLTQKVPLTMGVTFVNNSSVSSVRAKHSQPKQRVKSKQAKPVLSSAQHIYIPPSTSKHHVTALPYTATITANTLPQAFTNHTIHMPHGSDAAAAAAAGIMPTSSGHSSTTTVDGFAISHTACPMDLLNKGGRIGIYLPEERKARIAKFHSKRKIRIWRKRIKYDCRKKLADSRPRIKGRFVKRSDVDDEE